ncbi:MAG: hypothetical protein CL521_01670 [Actinobacteria bacterium]|nr:hypothetical protein [Actinomycetota bacterium]
MAEPDLELNRPDAIDDLEDNFDDLADDLDFDADNLDDEYTEVAQTSESEPPESGLDQAAISERKLAIIFETDYNEYETDYHRGELFLEDVHKVYTYLSKDPKNKPNAPSVSKSI